MAITRNFANDNETIDFALIIGTDKPDRKTYSNLIKAIAYRCQSLGLKYMILGNGISDVWLSDIQKLVKAKHVAIIAHGSPHAWKHRIGLRMSLASGVKDTTDTLEVIRAIQQQSGAKNLLLASCFAGKIINELKNSNTRELLEGTSLIATSAAYDVSMSENNINILNNYIDMIATKKTVSLISLLEAILKIIPEKICYLHQPEGKEEKLSSPLIFKSTRTDRILHLNVHKFHSYRITQLNEFINSVIKNAKSHLLTQELNACYPHFKYYLAELNKNKKIELLSTDLNRYEIEQFQKVSLDLHITHADDKILDAVLAKNKFSSALLYNAMYYYKKCFNDLECVLEVILKNLHNAEDGQTINAFTKDLFAKEYPHTPLTFAISQNNYNIVKLLLKYGADIYIADTKSRVPILMLNENEEIYSLLFPELISEMNIIYQSLLTIKPILAISLQKEISHFYALCQEENDLDFCHRRSILPKNKNVFYAFQTCLTLSHQLSSHLIMQPSMHAIKADLHNAFGPLFLRDHSINFSHVLHLLSQKTLPHSSQQERNMALHLTAVYGLSQAAIYLLKLGALAITDQFGNHILQIALQKYHHKYIKILLNYALHVNIPILDMNHLLHFLARWDHPKKFLELVQLGYDVNVFDTNGHTPFHVAAKHGSTGVLKLLLSMKIDTNLPDKSGLTPLQIAIKNHRKEVALLLAPYSAAPNQNRDRFFQAPVKPPIIPAPALPPRKPVSPLNK